MKADLTELLRKEYGTAYISTDDVATASVCTTLLKARASLLPPGRTANINTAVDIRQNLKPPLSAGYVANCHSGALVDIPLDEM